MNKDVDDRIADLLRKHPDVDPSTIAAYIERTLPALKRLRLERRLAADPEAQLMLRELRTKHVKVAPLLAAVAAILAVGVSVYLWSQRNDSAPIDFGAQLTATVASLRASELEAFSDFELVADDELAMSGVVRGGGRWVYPRGNYLRAPETLQWELPKGATTGAIEIRGDDLVWKQEHRGTSLRAPALKPGRYTVIMKAADGLARQAVRATFTVLDDKKASVVTKALDHIESSAADEATADVLSAHYLYRARNFSGARAAVDRAWERGDEARARVSALREHFEANGIR